MTTTPQQLIDQWKIANPFPLPVFENGISRLTSQEDYDAMLAERVVTLTKQAARMNEEEARTALRKKYRAAKTILDTPVGSTAADVRTAVIQHRNILSGLIEVLKDASLILDG